MNRLEDGRQAFWKDAALGRFAGQVNLHEDLQAAARRRGSFFQPRDERAIVHRVNRGEMGGGFPGLVRLKVAYQVPREGKVRGGAHFPEGFLNLVLAEVELSSLGGGAYMVGGKCLGDGDEADPGGVASRPAGGARDTFANAVQPGAERG